MNFPCTYLQGACAYGLFGACLGSSQQIDKKGAWHGLNGACCGEEAYAVYY